GEAGPEAIMPLARTASGKLGVAAAGIAGGGGDVEVHVHNAPAGSTATARTSQGANGMRIDIELKRMVEDQVSGQIDSGRSKINQSMERRYGLDPTRGMG